MTDVYDAVVLAGGSARRLGGADKASLEVGGTAMLDRVLLATATASRTIVVGPARDTIRPVTWTREDPPGGGPVAALAAGLEQVTSDRVLLVAADLPFLDASTVALLTGELLGRQQVGAVMVDGDRPQWLCGGWCTEALRAALSVGLLSVGLLSVGSLSGASLRDVLGPLRPLWVGASKAPGQPMPWVDVDTEDDLAWARSKV